MIALLRALLVAVVMATFSRVYLIEGLRVPSPSMRPTLEVGDYLLVNKFIFDLTGAAPGATWLPARSVERGDLVVFKFPGSASQNYLKRCIGLPGDAVALRNGQLWINGSPVYEAWGGGAGVAGDFGPLMVPPGQLFVLGDNRGDSSDSRGWGTVPRSYIKGRPVVVYWSRRPAAEPQATALRWRRLFLVPR